ncbi:MAG: hypothetical protein EOO20_13175, partial [Chryseobacterium sp.]
SSCDPKGLINLSDANYYTLWTGKSTQTKSLSKDPQWVQYEYFQPTKADNLWVGGNCFSSPTLVEVQVSDNGKDFRKIAEFKNANIDQFQDGFPNTKARFFRVVFSSNAASVLIGELAIGKKAEVNRITQMAAKLGQNGPTGVHSNTYQYHLDFAKRNLDVLPDDRPVAKQEIIDITKFCTPDGKINWDVPPGDWKIVRIGETNTTVVAGDGLLMDYMSTKGTQDQFTKFMKLLIADAGPYVGTTLKYFHEDNNEIKGPYNWTPGFMNEFNKLRGYDMAPYASILSGQIVESVDITNRFLQDYRRTIADLVADRHYGDLADSARKYGMGMDAEAGGQYLPFILNHDGLMNLGRMDIPVAEFWVSPDWKENQYHDLKFRATDPKTWAETSQNINAKQATSAGHIYGKKIIASESFTSLGANAHWRAAPADLLLHANVAFCEGINRMVLHSSTTQKEEDGKPGYEYKAGTHFNPNVTWWKDMGPFFKFISRCENMLQRGLFVADVLYYNGDDVPNIVVPKHIPADLGFGYDYDVCNTEVLLTRLSVKNGRLTLPDGMSYKVLVLPNTKSYHTKALEKIKQLIGDGAIVIGSRPESALGLTNYPASDIQVSKLAADVWGDIDGKTKTRRTYGAGKIFSGISIKAVLAENRVVPDFAYKTLDTTDRLDFIHRQDGDTEIYFVANRRNRTTKAVCTFRVNGKQAEIWNPFNGNTQIAQAFKQSNGTISLPVELGPYGSTFVVFRKLLPNTKQGAAVSNEPKLQLKKEITGAYTVKFDKVWGGPESAAFNVLQDWSTNAKDSIRYFSGTARYSKQFNGIELALQQPGKRIILDLGDVQNTAHVWLNGKDLGIVWAPPYRVDITSAVVAQNNKLEIDVTNSWVNRLIGDAKLPVERRLTKTNIVFSPDGKLTKSGLLGPLKIYEVK